MSASATVLPEKATHQQTRAFNQQLVLRALHDRSPLSRADLARITGLTRTSVGDLVGTLMTTAWSRRSVVASRAGASPRSSWASLRTAAT